MPRRKLRPINETRRTDGTFTSETAARLLRRRGGLTRAKQQEADGFKLLARMRLKSLIVRSAKSRLPKPCQDCRAFSERVLRYLDQLEAADAELKAKALHSEAAA